MADKRGLNIPVTSQTSPKQATVGIPFAVLDTVPGRRTCRRADWAGTVAKSFVPELGEAKTQVGKVLRRERRSRRLGEIQETQYRKLMALLVITKWMMDDG